MPFGFSSMIAAWLFLLSVPLIVFYFLKLKRPHVRISSLVLWSQVINDSRVNSPFQRFKRNILLFLQLLLLALIVLAAMQPFWRGHEWHADRLPILIDCSASMAALDRENGVSRLDEAKRRVRERIDNLARGQELCLIAVSRSAHKLTGFTDNKRILRDALDRLKVDDVESEPDDAYRMAEALNRTTPFDSVLFYSDGNIPPATGFQLPYRLTFEQIAQGGPNVGISTVSATRGGESHWNVFVGINGTDGDDHAGTVTIEREGEQIGEQLVAFSGSSFERIAFRVDASQATSLTISLRSDAFDSLAADNVAYIDLPSLRPLFVYVSTSLPDYRHALQGIQNLRVFPDEDGATDGVDAYDLLITAEEDEMNIPCRVGFYVGTIPDNLEGLVTTDERGSTIVDWQRNAPLLQHVNLLDLIISDGTTYLDESNEAQIEEAGFQVLVHGTRGPLLVRSRSENSSMYYLLFHSDRSTLPYRVGFPVLVRNLAQLTMSTLGLNEIQGRRTGVIRDIALLSNDTYVVNAPNGKSQETTTDDAGLMSGVTALQAGHYRISGPGADIVYGASLLSLSETSLSSVDEIEFEELTVAAAGAALKTDRALWPYLAFVAFILLFFEWWFFQRRPGGRPNRARS